MTDARRDAARDLAAALARASEIVDHDAAAALEQAQDIVRQDPHNGDALRLLGRALRRLGRDADAFPDSDIGLLRAAGVASPRELRALAEAWRPYRGYAATLLWAIAP